MASNGKIDLSGEAVGQATQVADGFWMIATDHRPGYSKHQPVINNRFLAFRLEENGEQVLLGVNGVAGIFDQVHALEEEIGLKLKYLVSPGGGHHVSMGAWHDEFPEAQLLIPPARIPRTANGKKLMAMPRVSTLDAANPLAQFKGQLDAVLFDGLLGAFDGPTPGEGGKDTKWEMMKQMFRVMFATKDPVDELWLHHVATGTVIGGENLGWMFTPKAHAELPGMMRKMMPVETVWVMPFRKVGDKQKVANHWKSILEWPAQTVMTYHDPPGYACQSDAKDALTAAVAKVKQA